MGLACAVVLFCTLGAVLPTLAVASDIVVRRDPGLSAKERADVRADAGVKFERSSALSDSEIVTVPDDQLDAALVRLNADPDVRVAAPNVHVRVASDPSYFDVRYPLSSQNTSDVDVDAIEAWERAPKRGEGVTVAVVDQGVWAQHPELDGNVDPAVDFITENTCDRLDPPAGRDDHGTHIAGLIAAHQDDLGMSGLAPGARVLPLRALDDCGDGLVEDVARAFEYAGTSGIAIVSGSFATSAMMDPADRVWVDELFQSSIEPFPNTLFVVAAGNEGVDIDGEQIPIYPCSTASDNLVCVGATDGIDKPTCYGNVGASSVDLFAPGEGITSSVRPVSPAPPRSFATLRGTSQATALVSAAAALVLSDETYSGVTAGDLKEELRRVDTPFGLSTESAFGGRLSAAKALERSPRPPSFGNGGLGGLWTSCNPDHDTFQAGDDLCPLVVGPNQGCPDTDGDLKHDGVDNCVDKPNQLQEDFDRDGIGDACDTDIDGDGVQNVADRCPREYAQTGDGCPRTTEPTPTPTATPTPIQGTPTPTPTPEPLPAAPRVTLLDVKVTPKSCKGRKACKVAAKVTVKVSRSATVVLRVERKVGRKWRQVTFKSLKASMSGKSLTVRGTRGKSLTRGRYRVTATINGIKTLKSFKV
jgi:hypothetical protein